jgi:hypothetical protein
LLPHFDKRDRQVDRDGGLADAALAGADRDDVLHAGHGLTRSVGADGLAHPRAHLHVHRADAGQLHHRRARLIAHLILDRTRRRRQLDREPDTAAVDGEALDEPQADDVAIEIRIAYDLQRLEDGRLLDLHIHKNIVHSRPRV